MSSPPFKECSCCNRAFTEAQWKALGFIGRQVDDVETLELRNCLCGSTLAVVAPAVPYRASIRLVPRTVRPATETAVDELCELLRSHVQLARSSGTPDERIEAFLRDVRHAVLVPGKRGAA